MHHDGSSSSQLSCFASSLPPPSPLFLPGSWPSTILSILHALLGLFTGAWGMVYLQEHAHLPGTTPPKKTFSFPPSTAKDKSSWTVEAPGLLTPSMTKCWRAQSRADFTQAVTAAVGLESWLSSQESLLLLQKTRVWFSEPMLGGSQPSVTPAPGNPKPLWVPAITSTYSHPDTQTHIRNLVKSSTKVMSCLEFSIPHHPPPRLFHSSSLFFCDILWALLGNVQTFCLWLGMQWLFIINILAAYGSLNPPLTMTKDFTKQSWYQH